MNPDILLNPENKVLLQEFRDHLLSDFERYARKFLKIKDEKGNIIPLILNDLQKLVIETVLKRLKSGQNAWIVVLKCRQTGISTVIQAFIKWLHQREENQKALTMGHELKASNNLFDMYNRYWKFEPFFLQQTKEKSNEKKVRFSNQSENLIDTAIAGEVGRSATFQQLHLTEVAFYPNQKQTLTALLQGSKYAKLIVIETTANGFNGFRDFWYSAVEGKNSFIPIFLAWHKFKSYTRPFLNVDEENKLLKNLGTNVRYNEYLDEERILIEVHKCSLEQLNWRRWAIDNLCDGDVTMFHQEYPTTDKEAFIASGRPYFDTRICNVNLNKANKDPKRFDLVYNYDSMGKMIGVVPVYSSKGIYQEYTEVNYRPEEHNIYAGGVDVAEGLEQGDYSVIKVLDRRVNKVAITSRLHIDPDLLGEELHKLQIFLGPECWFNVENNNQGIAVINSAYKKNVNLMYRQDFEQGIEITKDQLGTRTTGGYAGEQSKSFMCSELNQYIREALYVDESDNFWSECLTFVKDEKGRLGAQDKLKDPGVKCYDDEVMASAMMIRCHKWMPAYHKDERDKTPSWLKEKMKKNNPKKSVMAV
jgi:hypothetical protein